MAASNSGGPFTAEFDKLVAHVLDHFHVPSVSISVVDGKETFAKARDTNLLTSPYLSVHINLQALRSHDVFEAQWADLFATSIHCD